MKKNKIGRNAPCWCGSGEKYKRCHLDRENSEQININQVSRDLAKIFQRKTCMHPDAPTGCSRKFIKAHTISKCHFSNIAKKGKIYFYNKTSFNKIGKDNGRFYQH